MSLKKTTFLLLFILLNLCLFSSGLIHVNAQVISEDSGICIHHPFHTDECGYIEGESLCEFSCDQCSGNSKTERSVIERSVQELLNKKNILGSVKPSLLNERKINKVNESDVNDPEIAEILEKIEEDYENYGILPPAIISEQNYSNGIATVASYPIDVIIAQNFFEFSGLDSEIQSSISWEGYTVDNNPVTAEKFPNLEDYHYEFDSVTVDQIPVMKIGVILLDDNSELIYYISPAQKDEGISVSILYGESKFSINYKIKTFNIDYEVYIDGVALNEAEQSDITLDTIFGADRPTQTYEGGYSFNVTIPFRYTGKVLRKETNDPNGSEVDLIEKYHKNITYEFVNTPEDQLPSSGTTVDLGSQLSYVQNGDEIRLKDDSPAHYKNSETFYDDNVRNDRTVIVRLASIQGEPLLDVSKFLFTNYASGRGTSGSGLERNEKDGNIATIDSWNWTANKSSTDYTNRDSEFVQKYFLFKKDEETNLYSRQWIFQTNSSDSYLLDSLELNGVDLEIPYQATYRRENKNNTVDDFITDSQPRKTSTQTILPDGAIATLELYREFIPNYDSTTTQRVYILTIENAQTDVTVSGGNLMQHKNGAAEFIINSLRGVYDGENKNRVNIYHKDNDWRSFELSNPHVNDNKNSDNNKELINTEGDPSVGGANVMFILRPGYENPYFIWKNPTTGNVLQTSENKEIVDLDKWLSNESNKNKKLDPDKIYVHKGEKQDEYYFRLEEAPGNYSNDKDKLFTLEIFTTPIQYMVRYWTNTEKQTPELATGFPSYDHSNHIYDSWGIYEHLTEVQEQCDDSDGNFYNPETNSTIAISSSIPIDKNISNLRKTFKGWRVVDENEQPETDSDGNEIIFPPSKGIELEDVAKYATVNNELDGDLGVVKVIRLQDVWESPPDRFNYNVQIAYPNPEEPNSYLYEPARTIETEIVSSEDKKLQVYVDKDNDYFVSWLAQHPLYSFDDFKNTSDTENQEVDLDSSKSSGKFSPLGNYKFEVSDDATILIYMKASIGELQVAKEVEGIENNSAEFNFEIIHNADSADDLVTGNYYAWPTNEPVRTAANARVIEFKKETFTNNSKATFKLKGGESLSFYLPFGEYTIKETSTGSYKVEIIGGLVEGPNDNSIVKSISEDNNTESVVFKNSVNPVTLNNGPIIEKTVEGENPPKREFNFRIESIKDYGDKVEFLSENKEINISLPKENTRTESASFNGLVFNFEGEYDFTIVEDQTNFEDENGFYQADSLTHTLTIIIKNNNGTLKIDRALLDGYNFSLDREKISFKNTYYQKDAVAAYSPLIVYKELLGRDLQAHEFTFNIELEEGDPSGLDILKNQAFNELSNEDNVSKVDFGHVRFTQPGVYKLKVTEVNNGVSGIIYDDDPIFVTYTVESINNRLEVTNTDYGFKNIFTNKVLLEDSLKISKTVNGRQWQDSDSFEIELELISGKSSDIKIFEESSDEPNLENIVLSKDYKEKEINLQFLAEGTYVLKVYENYDPNYPGLSFDNSVYYVTYTVNNGSIDCSIRNPLDQQTEINNKTINFINTYHNQVITVPIRAHKEVVGLPQSGNQYQFELRNKDQVVIQTANTEYGDIIFSGLQFSAIELAQQSTVFEYTLSEIEGNNPLIEYDKSLYKVIITVTENNDILSANVEYKDSEGQTVPVPTFVNKKIAVGDLQVKKVVQGTEEDKQKSFNFRVELSKLTDPDALENISGDMIFVDNVAEFTLKHGESKTAFNLPDGLKYEVTEESDSEFDTGYSDSNQGTIQEFTTSLVEVTNTRKPPEVKTGDLTVSKTVTGSGGDTDKEFEFTITLDDNSISGTYGDMDFEEGVTTFTLKHGESETAEGLPEGTHYTVSETEANLDGYTTTVEDENDEGFVQENETIEVSFINYKEKEKPQPEPGKLNIFLSHRIDSNKYHQEKQKVKSGQQIDFLIQVTNKTGEDLEDVEVINPIPEQLILDKNSVTVFDSENQIIDSSTIDISDSTELRVILANVDQEGVYYIEYSVTASPNEDTVYWINHAYINADLITSEDDKTRDPIEEKVPDDSEYEISEESYEDSEEERIIEDTDLEDIDLIETFDLSETEPINVLDIDKDLASENADHTYEGSDIPSGIKPKHSKNGENVYDYSNDLVDYYEVAQQEEIKDITILKEQQYNNVKTTGNVIVTRGEEITYYITVTNENASSLNDVVISDGIPSGLTVKSIGQNGKQTGNTISWNIGTLKTGTSTVSYTAVIPTSYSYTTWNNTATVNWKENEKQTPVSSNTVTAQTPEIKIDKEQSTSKVSNIPRTKDYIEFKPGDVVTYYLTVTNTGKVTATNLVVGDYIPEGLTFPDQRAGTTGIQLSRFAKENYIYWEIASLDPGESKTFQASFLLPEVVTEKVYYKNIGYVDWDENGLNDSLPSNEVIIGDPPSDDPIVTPEGPGSQPSNPGTTVTPESSTTQNTTTTTTTKTNSVTSGVTSSPKTGVETNSSYIWLALIVLCGAVLIFLYVSKKSSSK